MRGPLPQQEPSVRPVRPLPFQDRTLRDAPRFEILPQGDQEFARHRDDADLAHPATAARKPGLVPAREGTVRLVAQPAPGEVDRERADVAIAGARDPLLVLDITTLVVRGHQPRERTDLAAIVEGPPEKLHHVEPRRLGPDATERE